MKIYLGAKTIRGGNTSDLDVLLVDIFLDPLVQVLLRL
jgi:hypothetical protein